MAITWHREDTDTIPFAVCDECGELFQWGNQWHMQRLDGHDC